MNRRRFIKQSALASGVLMIPSFLRAFETDELTGDGKIFVVIQLSGGNDGLNTVVPFEDDLYYNQRTKIAIAKTDVIQLSDQLGFNPALKPLKAIWDNGWMNIINGVGYPNPDRSHFRSMDIWQTASESSEYLSTGWLGRYLDSSCSGCDKPYNVIEVDDTLSLALKGQTKKGIALKSPEDLYRSAKHGFFAEVSAGHDPSLLHEDNLGYLYKTMRETTSSADYIYQNGRIADTTQAYPDNAFANQLKTISRFIRSGLSTRVYYVSLGGFDTHNNQRDRQDKLLQTYADGVSAFLNDLKTAGKLNDVLVMTFSEFGRRVEQNASNGTDHGTANNIFLFGGALKKTGFQNDRPSLQNLDEGDLKFLVDFRNVYATVLDKWLNVSHPSILNKNFSTLDFV